MGKEEFSITLLKKTLRRKHDFQEVLGKMRLGEAEIDGLSRCQFQSDRGCRSVP